MKQRKPHHYCGILIFLLAVLSAFAWTCYPPAIRGTARNFSVPVFVLPRRAKSAPQPTDAATPKLTEKLGETTVEK